MPEVPVDSGTLAARQQHISGTLAARWPHKGEKNHAHESYGISQ